MELLEQHGEGDMRGLMFTIDLGDGCHEYGFVGSYKQDPSSAFMPAAQTLHQLGVILGKADRSSKN